MRTLAFAALLVAEAAAYSGLASRSAFAGRQAQHVAAARPVQLCQVTMGTATKAKTFIVGLAADSGCGKSTFMRRMTAMFSGTSELLDIGRETNTLVSDMTTVICLDDYHKYDRTGRKENDITALHKDCQKWDLMAEQVAALKNGETVMKPIYNHITGELDPEEEIKPTDIVIFEGLHPMLDERVRDLLDLSIYLDISDDVKFAWKIQRDMQERGHSLESIKQAIEGRKPDFEAFVAPQRKDADIVIEVLPTALADENEGKLLRVRYIQKKGLDLISAPYLFDEGSTITWVPNGDKLTAQAPGVKLSYGPEEYMGSEVTVLEMDGKIEKLEQIAYLEAALGNTGTKVKDEMCKQMLANKDAPGSDNGTGFFQTLCSFKIREAYEKFSGADVAVEV